MRRSLTSILFVFLLTSSLFTQEVEPVRVGVFLDMSGETSLFGVSTFNGIKMAVSEINASGGVNGRKLEIFIEDDKGRPDKAKEAVEKLIDKHKAHIIIGEVTSTNSLAGARVAQEARVPMLAPSATNPKVTEVGDFIFRACFIDPKQGAAMAKFAYKNLKLRRVAILGDGWSDYSKSLANDFRNTFRTLGGKISSDEEYANIESDFKTQLKRIRRKKPQGLYLPGYYGQVGIIAKQSRELGMTVPLLGGDGWDSPELWKLGGSGLINSYATTHFAFDNEAPTVKDFRKKYSAFYASEPDSFAALGYDSAYLLADALRRSKSLDGPVLRDALAATTSLHGITGEIVRFDGLRNPQKPVVVTKLFPKTSRFVYTNTIKQ